MYDFDSYLLYEAKSKNIYSVRIKVILSEPVRSDVLRPSAEKAFRRFPYYAKKVVTNKDGAYIFEPCLKPITVTPEDHVTRLGSKETNDLLFAITYAENAVFFNFEHNFCGGCGAMRWIKTTLWQYLTDLGYEISKEGTHAVCKRQ